MPLCLSVATVLLLQTCMGVELVRRQSASVGSDADLHLGSQTSKSDPTCPPHYIGTPNCVSHQLQKMQVDCERFYEEYNSEVFACKWDGGQCVQGEKCTISVADLVKANSPAAAATVDYTTCEDWSVEYNGKCYAVLPQTPPNTGQPGQESAAVACHSDFLPLPAGYQLADYSDDIQTNVASQHWFGTWRVVYSNGKRYGTGSGGTCAPQCGCSNYCGDCTFCGNNGLALTEDNGQYKVTSCDEWAQVFIVKTLKQTASGTCTSVTKLSDDHPNDDTSAGDCVNGKAALADCEQYCGSLPTCRGFWYYTNGRCCPKATWGNTFRSISGGAFYTCNTA